jgi:hypothetical protein
MKLQIIETPDYTLWVSDKGPELNCYCATEKNIVDVGKIHNSFTIFKPSTQGWLPIRKWYF